MDLSQGLLAFALAVLYCVLETCWIEQRKERRRLAGAKAPAALPFPGSPVDAVARITGVSGDAVRAQRTTLMGMRGDARRWDRPWWNKLLDRALPAEADSPMSRLQPGWWNAPRRPALAAPSADIEAANRAAAREKRLDDFIESSKRFDRDMVAPMLTSRPARVDPFENIGDWLEGVTAEEAWKTLHAVAALIKMSPERYAEFAQQIRDKFTRDAERMDRHTGDLGGSQ